MREKEIAKRKLLKIIKTKIIIKIIIIIIIISIIIITNDDDDKINKWINN